MVIATDSVRSDQRYTNGRRCVICGGADRDPRGKGRRCYGFTSADRKYAHCSREEHAGGLAPSGNSGTYAHRLTGPCNCGTTHGTDDGVWSGIEAAYDYRDERGTLLFQVVRMAGEKTFRQRKPDGAGGWIWKTGGTRRVLYMMRELLKASAAEVVYFVEGEKDVERLRAVGAVATTTPGGAKSFGLSSAAARDALKGRHVVLLPDADDPGRDYTATVATQIADVAASVRMLDLFPDEADTGHDVSDWLDAGHTFAELQQIASSVEPSSTSDAQSDAADPWQAEIDQALADVKGKLEASTTGKREPLFRDAVDLLQQEFDGARWLVDGLITRGGVAMIGGEPKAAIKTWSAAELAVAVVTGTKAFGEFFAARGVAVYFFAEDLDVQVRNRVRSLLAGADRTLARGRLHLRPRGVFLDVMRDEDLAWIVASARRVGPIDLLILDPLRDIHSGEEDKSDSMREVMRRLRVLAEVLGCAVLVVHHAVKRTKDNAGRNAGQNFRGSSAIHGSLDALLAVEESSGDGTNVFKTRVTSQVKGARSAGAFTLELAIADDSQGEAVSASWTFAKSARKTGAVNAEQFDLDMVFGWIRDLAMQGVVLTETALRMRADRPVGHNGRQIGQSRVRDLIKQLAECKGAARARLIYSDGLVKVAGQECSAND